MVYTFSGNGILSLNSDGIHKLWKWQKTEANKSGQVAVISCNPLLVLPFHDLIVNEPFFFHSVGNGNFSSPVVDTFKWHDDEQWVRQCKCRSSSLLCTVEKWRLSCVLIRRKYIYCQYDKFQGSFFLAYVVMLQSSYDGWCTRIW